MKSRVPRVMAGALSLLIVLYGILLIPDYKQGSAGTGERSAFAWSSDDYWTELEQRFVKARQVNCDDVASDVNARLSDFRAFSDAVYRDSVSIESPLWQALENSVFELSVSIAACPDSLEGLIMAFGDMRTAVKDRSLRWDVSTEVARDRLYRLLYGGRTAIEEVILQVPQSNLPPVFVENDEPSKTPSAKILGVTIHSGDILVSRGGAPTSALIARGNDYPGNFSHVALVHVDDSGRRVSIIESHIEIGVAVADVDAYFKDKKLRVMVLRPRADLPLIQTDPMLPHKASAYALNRARNERIDYDFAMDTEDPVQLFCSEVAFDAYRQYGLQLWSALSHISSVGVRDWLAAFGVENFTTMEPSDLEYDPQLRVVAEWRDYEALYKDHLDNAVVDVMLESANKGDQLEYNLYMLPIARVLKGYSFVLNCFGQAGPIPEGMNATAALRNEWYSNRHAATVERLEERANRFQHYDGYLPPYWQLVELAREAYREE